MGANLSAAESRALELLGTGKVLPVQVALACGVSESRISQLMSDVEFAGSVAELRYKNLTAETARDGRYDSLEDQILKKMEDVIPLIMNPLALARILQIVNSAKRRGSAGIDQNIQTQAPVVQISMPTIIKQKFITNVNQQVIRVGDKDLTTIGSGFLLKKTQDMLSPKEESNDESTHTTAGTEGKVAA